MNRSRIDIELIITFAESPEGGLITPAVLTLLHQLGGDVFLGRRGGVHLVNFYCFENAMILIRLFLQPRRTSYQNQ